MLRLIAAVEAAKVPGRKKRNKERASAACKDVACVPQSKITDAADEDIADDDIEKAPEDVDGRRREALSRRLGEGALKRPARHAADDMRDCVRKERATKEIGQERKRGHLTCFLRAGGR
jgi:hypothetical protein